MRRSLAVGVLALAAAACGGEASQTGPATTSPVPGPAPTTSPAPATSGPAPATTVQGAVPGTTSPVLFLPPELTGRPLATIRLDEVELFVAVADDLGSRVQGLRFVSDLGPLDGMLFVWDGDTDSTFWMQDTVIALDIAWFTAAGEFVSALTMTPCPEGEPCPEYAAAARYRYALEMPAGTMPELSEGSRLDLPGGS